MLYLKKLRWVLQKLEADKKMYALFREIETRFKKKKSNVEI